MVSILLRPAGRHKHSSGQDDDNIWWHLVILHLLCLLLSPFTVANNAILRDNYYVLCILLTTINQNSNTTEKISSP